VYAPFAAGLLDDLIREPAHINPDKIARIVFSSILVPLVLGVAIRRWMPGFAEKIAHPLMVFAISLLAIGAIILLFVVWPTAKALIGNGTVLIIALVVLLGTVAGHLLGGPDPTNRTALALSTGARHPAVAFAVATSGGADPREELGAILLYAIIGAILLIPYVKQRPKATAGMKVDQ
jgi:BASS family bile acid:Na+ symporter